MLPFNTRQKNWWQKEMVNSGLKILVINQVYSSSQTLIHGPQDCTTTRGWGVFFYLLGNAVASRRYGVLQDSHPPPKKIEIW